MLLLLLLLILGGSGHCRLRLPGVRGEWNDDDDEITEELASCDVDKSADAEDVRSRRRYRLETLLVRVLISSV